MSGFAASVLKKLDMPVPVMEVAKQVKIKEEPVKIAKGGKKYVKRGLRAPKKKPGDEGYGVYYSARQGGYVARPRGPGLPECGKYLGTFSNEKRSSMAVKLFLLWHSRGFDKIPTGKGSGYVDYGKYIDEDAMLKPMGLNMISTTEQQLKAALEKLVTVYDDPDGKQWTTTSKKEAIAEARKVLEAVTNRA